jgi:signal transduction histidine kinase
LRRIIKLKGELVIISLISLVISLTAAIMIKNQGIGLYSNSTYRINNIYSESITGLEKDLNSSNLSNYPELQQLLDGKYSFKVGYSFYVVDTTGTVVAGSNKGLLAIDMNEIIDGKKEYSNSQTDNNVFKISGCDYLKDGYFLYYVFLRYGQDDTGMLVYALIGSLICFLLFIWGRISYISKIKTSVAIIAEGDLTHRAPLKYRNELRDLAEDINFMTSELEKEDQKRSEFMTNISHDIRTPLTTILGYIEMIKKEKYDSKEEMNKYINIIERKGLFLTTMMEDFFQYSKLTSKDIVLNYENLEFNELARQLFEDEESGFEERSLKLELELSNEPVYIYGDSDLLARAVNNLLSNSLKYSKPNTVVKIKISKEKLNNVNYGIFSLSNVPKEPISEAEVDSFFERLYKKDQSRSEEGSGLGLSIVKDIIKLHGGTIKGYKEKEELIFKFIIGV